MLLNDRLKTIEVKDRYFTKDAELFNFMGYKFEGCKFNGFKMSSCCFNLCTFNNCIFENCTFLNHRIQDSVFDGTKFMNCSFMNLVIYNCFGDTIVENCKIQKLNIMANSIRVFNFIGCKISGIEIVFTIVN